MFSVAAKNLDPSPKLSWHKRDNIPTCFCTYKIKFPSEHLTSSYVNNGVFVLIINNCGRRYKRQPLQLLSLKQSKLRSSLNFRNALNCFSYLAHLDGYNQIAYAIQLSYSISACKK